MSMPGLDNFTIGIDALSRVALLSVLSLSLAGRRFWRS
jgi:hypothetical protein